MYKPGQEQLIFFCVHNGFCNFHVHDIGKLRIEHHFSKYPDHRILEEDFNGWKYLANHRRYLRDVLRRRRQEYGRFPPLRSQRYPSSTKLVGKDEGISQGRLKVCCGQVEYKNIVRDNICALKKETDVKRKVGVKTAAVEEITISDDEVEEVTIEERGESAPADLDRVLLVLPDIVTSSEPKQFPRSQPSTASRPQNEAVDGCLISRQGKLSKLSPSVSTKMVLKLPTFLSNCKTNRKPKQTKAKNKKVVNQKGSEEMADMARLFDKKVVKKKHLNLLNKKKKSVDKMSQKDESVELQRKVVTPDKKTGPLSFEMAPTLSDVSSVRRERAYINKEMEKSEENVNDEATEYTEEDLIRQIQSEKDGSFPALQFWKLEKEKDDEDSVYEGVDREDDEGAEKSNDKEDYPVGDFIDKEKSFSSEDEEEVILYLGEDLCDICPVCETIIDVEPSKGRIF